MLAAALLPAPRLRVRRREAAPAAADVRLERSDQAFALGRDVVRVEIDNPWGEITLRNRDERELGVHAVIQCLPPAFAPAALRTRRDRGTLRVAVEFPAAAARGRIDLAVYLPADVAVVLATRDGRIAAKRRSGPVEAAGRRAGRADRDAAGRRVVPRRRHGLLRRLRGRAGGRRRCRAGATPRRAGRRHTGALSRPAAPGAPASLACCARVPSWNARFIQPGEVT